MDKNSVWKWLILIALAAWSMVVVTPLKEKVRLGLDLQGGTRFVMQVDTSELEPDVARDAQPRALEVIRNRVDALGVAEPVIYTEPGNRIVVEIPGMKAEDREGAAKLIQSAAFLEFRMVHAKNDDLVEELFTKGDAPKGYKIVSVDNADNRRSRRNQYYKRDKSQDPAGVREEQVRRQIGGFHAPPGFEMLLEKELVNGQELFVPYFVNKRRELTGESLSNAGYEYDQVMRPYVTLKFDSKGARRFATLTSDYAPGGAKNPSMNSSRLLAIVLDGTLYSAPAIREPIFGGSAQITGNFTLREVQEISIALRAGALPAPVTLLEERTVDPTLGQDSINSGKRATLIGSLAVMAFMAGYYLLAGMIANVALILNILLLPLGLMVVSGFFSLLASQGGPGGAISLPVLTLPGIAGIALTIGMAVDANVLIYERMREEQGVGKRLKAVIDAGYHKAFSAILDSNVTTILSAVILFWLGTGPVRGYAVTLTAGLIVSMYTALVCTRMIFNVLADKTKMSQVRMVRWIKHTDIDFLGKRFIYISLSVAVIAAGGIGMFMKGKSMFGVDFTGGSAITFQYQQKQDVEKIRSALAAAGIRDAFIQYQTVSTVEGQAQVKEYLEIKVAFEERGKVSPALTSQIPDGGFQVLKEDSVGPQIGRELQKKAFLAIALSLVGIAIYVSIRFEFPFAMGAILSLLHDALMAPGIFVMMGHQLNVSMVAAILTIIGYSVNDTIVIFDRIRENVKLEPGRKFYEIANESINQCLGRTILTTFATLLSVIALLVFGGGSIHDFTLLLFIGMLSGVYSTVYIATPMVLLWHRSAKT